MSKTIQSKATGRSIFSVVDIFEEKKVSGEAKRKALNEAKDFLFEQTLEAVGSISSPVSGGKYKKTLNKEYRAKKVSEGGRGVPNLELEGDMLNAFQAKIQGSNIKLGILGNSKEAKKADGHNNFSGKSKIPTRQFLPQKGQSYKSPIEKELARIVDDAVADSVDITKSDLRDIFSKTALLAFLGEKLPDLTPSERKGSILRNKKVSEFFEDLGLLKWLE